MNNGWDFGWGMNEEAHHQGREVAQLCLSPRIDWACEPTKHIGADRQRKLQLGPHQGSRSPKKNQSSW